VKSKRVDALVVGGGPAGLATAIALRLQGLDVDLLERRRPPIDKACGEGLMPSAQRPLLQLGVEIEGLEKMELHGIRYVDGDLVAAGRFTGAPGWGIRRLNLHQALVRRALEVGVATHWGAAAAAVEQDEGGGFVVDTGEGRLACDWLVAADGLHSRLRKRFGLERRVRGSERFGVRRHYALPPWSDHVEVHWAAGCEAYVTPVAPELIGVAMLWSGRKADFDQLLALFPALQDRLCQGELASRDRGAGPFRQRLRAVCGPRVAFVGDASGYVDALTGEGLAIAFRQALVLADAIAASDLRRYEAAHRRLVRAPELFTELTLLLTRSVALRRRVIAALAARPQLFARLLAVQNGNLPLHAGAGALLRLLGRAALTT
jgi:flavin-dependent dehydrogenase